jgi:hypothetical protein
VWRRGSKAALSEAETRPRGCQALEGGEDFVAWRLVLERGGDSPEGYHHHSFGGPLRLSRPWALCKESDAR